MTYTQRPKRDEEPRPETGLTLVAPDSKPGKLANVLGMPLEYVNLVKDVAAKGTTDEEFCLFLQICHDTGLNPLTREIWCYKLWDTLAGRELPVIHASIQGKRKAADRIGGYCPGKETEYRYDNAGNLLSATAHVKRKIEGDWQEVSFTAFWDEFVKYKRDGRTLSGKWATMGHHMLGKCAENHALNRAFPQLEQLAEADSVPTANFAEAFSTPGAEAVPGAVDPEVEHKRRVLVDNLTTMGEVLLDADRLAKLKTYMETAPLDALQEKHATALLQFTTYARGVYEAIPDEVKAPALGEFNVDKYEDLDFEGLVRFCYMFQKPIEDQEHPANVPVTEPEPPTEDKPTGRPNAKSRTRGPKKRD